jgi:predicted transcriptional regulator
VRKYLKSEEGRSNYLIYKRKQKNMIIEINNKIKDIINEMPFNKTVKNNAIKIYAALYLMSRRKNKFGYFPVPSDYLVSINKRYSRIINHFEKEGMIKSYTRPVQDEKDIFNIIDKKYYDVNKGICMKYKFLISTEGEQINVDMVTNRQFRWYDIIQESLLEFGFEDIKITRDTFGRRVHHSGIQNYKEDFKGYWTIDAASSQPRLLWLDMKEKGIIDPLYNSIFENGKDFYLEIQHKLNIKDRDDAKELFMFWVNSNGYVPNFNIHTLFPLVSSYIKKYKSGDYKNMASHLQRIESKIWIDDILNNIPTNWALPVHDSLIVKEEDVETIHNYIRSKYPQLEIKKQIIK